jgi:hypothetical protein
MRAGFVAVSATNCCSVIRLPMTPPENSSASRVSTPGTPLGIFVKGAVVPAIFLPSGPSNRNGAWSELKIWNVPFASPSHT